VTRASEPCVAEIFQGPSQDLGARIRLLIASGERFCCHAPKASDLLEAFRELKMELYKIKKVVAILRRRTWERRVIP
jgi:hypothetical protein